MVSVESATMVDPGMLIRFDWSNSEAMLSALARVLREDWRKSLELSTNIIYIFFCFSSYTQFHPVIIQYRVCCNCISLKHNENGVK